MSEENGSPVASLELVDDLRFNALEGTHASLVEDVEALINDAFVVNSEHRFFADYGNILSDEDCQLLDGIIEEKMQSSKNSVLGALYESAIDYSTSDVEQQSDEAYNAQRQEIVKDVSRAASGLVDYDVLADVRGSVRAIQGDGQDAKLAALNELAEVYVNHHVAHHESRRIPSLYGISMVGDFNQAYDIYQPAEPEVL